MAEEIWHYGILGMKWGVRRTPEQLGRGTKGQKAKADDSHEDYKKAHDSKSVKKMSDAELRSRLTRLNMEQQYSKMNPTRVARGRQILNTSMKVVGTVAATSSTVITLRNNWNTISGWFGKS